MSILYDLVYLLALGLGWPYLIYRRLTRGPGSVAFGERLGGVPVRAVSSRCIWLHGVSFGEVNATHTLVDELHKRCADAAVVISSTTATGLAQARKLYPRLAVFRFPLDLSWTLNRVFARIRPSVIVLMELETWPNLLERARRRGISVLIANGRVTEEKTMRSFRRPVLRWLAQRMFGQVRWVGAQDATYAARFAELGVPAARIEVVSSLKYDTADLVDRVPGQDELAEQMGIDRRRPLWVAGSTGPGEEALVLDAYAALLSQHPELQLALIPRKPERFDEVAQLIVSRGFACLRRSTGAPAVPAGVSEPPPVFLGDTMGELRKFYGLASVVFVGRSLVPMGGSDMIEVAALARPVLIGPYTDNFAEAVELLLAAAAAERVPDAAALAPAVAALLSDAGRRARMGAAGRAAIKSHQGATVRTVEAILRFMPG